MWTKLFRVRKTQTLVMIFIISLCSTLLTSSFAVLFSMDDSYKKLAKETNAADMVIYLADGTEDNAKKIGSEIEKLPRVKKVVQQPRYTINEECYVGEKNIEAFLQIKTYNDENFGNIRYLYGNKETAKNLKDDECLIPACVFISNDLKLGETIRIKTTGGDIGYKIVGVYADIYNSSTAFDSALLVNKLPENMNQSNMLYLYTEGEYETADLVIDYKDMYGHNMAGNPLSKQSEISSTQLSDKILGAILCVIGVVMLTVSCIIIIFIIKNALLVDAKNIGIYKTMGYESRDVGKMYCYFYVFIAQFATLIGIILAKFFSDYLLNDMFKYIIEKANINILKVGWISYVLITGIVFITVLITVLKTRNVKPVYAINGLQVTNTKKKKKEVGAIRGFSPWSMAIRMIARNKRGMFGILLTSAVSVIGMNFAIVSLDVANNMKDNNDYWFGIDKCDIMIDLSEKSNIDDVMTKLDSVSGIRQIEKSSYNGAMLTMEWEKGMEDNVIYPFIYENYNLPSLECKKGRNPQKENEIAITGKIASIRKKEIGDYLTVIVDGVKKDYLITGIFQTYYNMGLNCRLTKEGYEGTDRVLRYDTISIYLEDGIDLGQKLGELKESLGGYGKVILRTEKFSSIMSMIMNPQQSAIPPMSVMSLFIGAANIFCILLLKNTREQRMNGIYKSIGYGSRHLTFATIIYVSILALFTMTIAIPTMLIFYPKLMTLALSMFGLVKYEVTYNVCHIVITNTLIYGFFIISTILSSRTIQKVSVRQLVVE